MSELLNKTLLKRYYLSELLGQGGMADVYLAWDKKRLTNVAIKKLHREKERDDRFGHLFAQEAKLLRELEHPGIVRIYEYIDQGNFSFIVMDYVEGTNLREAILQRRKPYSLIEITPLLTAVCTALNYAHQNKVLHCDIKPANILLHKDGRVLVTDFGVARWAGRASKGKKTISSGGTPRYMAPEQFESSKLSPSADIYALGIILFEMLSGGQVPFNGEGQGSQGSTPEARIRWEHKNLTPPPLTRYNPSVPSGIEKVVRTSLEKDPLRRYQTAMELLHSFEKIRPASSDVGSQTIIAPKPPPREPVARKPISRPSLTVAGVPKKSARLICRSGDYQGQVIPISPGELTLGRSQSNQITLKESGISRKHAVLIQTRRGIYIRDENSLMGTLLNNRRLHPGVPEILNHGDIIQIGYQQVFEFHK